MSGEHTNAGKMNGSCDGTNASVGDDVTLKGEFQPRRHLGYNLSNLGYCTEGPLEQVLSPLRLAPTSSRSSSATPVVEDVGNSPQLLAEVKNSGESKTVFEASGLPSSGETTYQLSSVIAVVAAFALAHFVLVIGGFTSSRGYEKLDALRQWLDDLFGSTARA